MGVALVSYSSKAACFSRPSEKIWRPSKKSGRPPKNNMTMKTIEDYVSYEQAARLKAAGFDEPCEMFYTDAVKIPCSELRPYAYAKRKNWNKTPDKVSAVPLWQAQKWLRETKGIAINVIAHDGGKYEYDIVFLPNAAETNNAPDRSPWCRTYEEALTDGIESAIELIKKGE